ncbi:unnamed protein product [Ixodes hexagonus]
MKRVKTRMLWIWRRSWKTDNSFACHPTRGVLLTPLTSLRGWTPRRQSKTPTTESSASQPSENARAFGPSKTNQPWRQTRSTTSAAGIL